MDNIYEKYRSIFWEVFSRYDLDADDLEELELSYQAMCKSLEGSQYPAGAIRYRLHQRAQSFVERAANREATTIPIFCKDADTEYASLVNCCTSALKEMLETLTPLQGTVLAMHYGFGGYEAMPTNAIANALNITRHMVQVTERRALFKLRKSSNRCKLEGFLSMFAEQPMYMLEVR